MFPLRNKQLSNKILSKLKAMKLNIRVMHVCGTHQDTVVKFGLDEMLKNVGIEIRQGPGCPVCVTTPKEIEEGILLAKKGICIATFGDIVRVKGKENSLQDMKTEGKDVKIVYSIADALKLAEKKEEVVFIGIGFETTAPSTASVLLNCKKENFSVLSCHRTLPNALKFIIESGEVKLNGLIEPGHVSTIIGVKSYEFLTKKYKVPQVIAGFEPNDLLMGVYMLAKQIKENKPKVENEYSRVVKYEGNEKAIQILKTVFEDYDVNWRGFPIIPNSGLKIKKEFEEHDARKKFENYLEELENVEFKEPKGCKCGEVLRGLIYSDECPLFGNVCNEKNPIGPCMVSREGSCNIMLKYRKTRL